MGVPVLTMELAVGRASRRSAVLGYQALEKPGQKWHIHGWFCLLGCCLLMMYYTTVTGWMVSYFFKFLTGTFSQGMATEAVSAVFGNLLSSPGEMAIWTEIVVLAGFVVCSFGLRNGLERISKIMMLALLALIALLAVHSLTLPGAKEGMKFYLLPSVDSIRENGIGNLIVDAMNQAFFTLSLGIAAMEIFGSRIGRQRSLTGEAVSVTALNTVVAILAGLIIFPACFAYGVSPDQGPSLVFVTLPVVFGQMPLGNVWGCLFFVFMAFASLSTVIAVFENLISWSMDKWGMMRSRAVIFNAVLVLVLSIPCALGFNVLSGVTIPAIGDIQSIEDFIVSNNLLPLGALFFVLFCTTRRGWGWDGFLAEANAGRGVRFPSCARLWLKFGIPALILVIFVLGYAPKIAAWLGLAG